MNWQRARWLGVGKDAGLAARCGGLLAAMMLVAIPVTSVAYVVYGPVGVLASMAAACCCLAGAVPPLVLAGLLRAPQFALHHAVLGMFFRMAIPLGIGLLVHSQRTPLSEAGFLYGLVIYFWVGLGFDTLSLVANSHTPPANDSSAGATTIGAA